MRLRSLPPESVLLFALATAGLLLTLGPWPTVVAGFGLYVTAVAIRPSWATPTLLLTLPFYLHPRHLGGFEVSVTELAIIGAVMGLGARALSRWWRREPIDLEVPRGGPKGSGGAWPPDFIDWIAAALLASGLISLLVTEYPRQSFRELRWLILEPLVAFYVVRATIRTSEQVLTSLRALAAAGAVASLIGLADLAARGLLLQRTARAMAPYLSANHLALFLERSAAAGLALALFGPRLTKTAGATAGLVIAALGRTVSVGAWIGFGAAALVLIGLKNRRWMLGAALAIALALGAALVVLPPERGLDRMNPSTGTGEFRVQIWTSALHMLADHPLLGVGLDNFLYLYRSQYMLPEAWEEPNISHPHNWILQFWLELGLPGLLTGIAMVVWVARAAHRRFYEPTAQSDRPLAATALGMLIAFLVHGTIDNSYFLVDLATVWWIVSGLLAVPLHTSGSVPRSSDPNS